ncbi:MAG: sigma-70 family RNA polymerase sigma factor [Candidatus Anammoximicrobium sp.]|nr:sigma-70 family RNA polymerase sigma factor [Candidatus Anammoximicrobium sp.]
MADRLAARELLQRYGTGEPGAATELHRRYAGRLLKLAEEQLGGRLRRREDADDVIQSVFRTFFRRAAGGEYSVQHSGALWELLTHITRRKIGRARRRHHAAKRDVAAEVDLDESAAMLAANVPSQEELVALLDELEHLLVGFAPWQAEIVHAFLAGQSIADIAQRVHRSRYTVRQVLNRTMHRLHARIENRQ